MQSIRNKGIERHFTEIGLDYALFSRMIDTDMSTRNKVNISQLRRFFRHANGSMYTRQTIEKWVRVYLESCPH